MITKFSKNSEDTSFYKIDNCVLKWFCKRDKQWKKSGFVSFNTVVYNHVTVHQYSMSTIQSCCGQVPELWKSGNWTCSECGSILPEKSVQLEIDWNKTVPKLPTGIMCDCGGAKSKTTHAFWCSTYTK